jgi:glycosyltransferase involved in cell wall biosynthesis
MKISIILTTYRNGKLLDIQLLAFADQTFPREDYEVVIIDDASIYRKDQIENFAKTNGMNIQWMRGKKPYYRSLQNIGSGRNTGLIHSKGELAIFIDDYSYIKPEYLEKMWGIYKENPGYSPIGPVVGCWDSSYKRLKNNEFDIENGDKRSKRITTTGVKLHCPSNWFYTSNASAPLREIIKANGFWELADLTREEDVMMGLKLIKNGWKFCYANTPETTVYHLYHGKEHVDKKYKIITYKDLGWDSIDIYGRTIEGGGGSGICGLNTKPDEIQIVTMDVFKTKFPGSWGLLEYLLYHPDFIFNTETGFNLKEEREKIRNWI